MLVVDIRHWLDETLSGLELPQLNSKVKKPTEIITHATAKRLVPSLMSGLDVGGNQRGSLVQVSWR